MKYMDEYRNPQLAKNLIREIKHFAHQTWNIMEICGGQTHAILRFGIDRALTPEVQLIHGPGCPVCVTPIQKIDLAIQLALETDIILCSFGEKLRVQGSKTPI